MRSISFFVLQILIQVNSHDGELWPDKMTYISVSPKRSGVFMQKYFGMSPRALNFDKGSGCAEVVWLNLCQSPEVATYKSKEVVKLFRYQYFFGMVSEPLRLKITVIIIAHLLCVPWKHFVHTPKHPQGL